MASTVTEGRLKATPTCRLRAIGQMTPSETQRLIRKIQDSIDASHRLHQELLDTVRALLEDQTQSVPSPAKQAITPVQSPERLYLDTRAAADHLGLSRRTLEQWRVSGGGPPFIKMGAGVRHNAADLQRWVETRTRRSTSDPGPRHQK